MPKIRAKKVKYPAGWDAISPTLDEFESKMRDAESADSDGKRKEEVLWPLFRLHHLRSRYIYEMHFLKRAISRELYDFCVKHKLADAELIAKWKKQGYERLCCLRCIQQRDTNYGTTCICRVPAKQLENGKIFQCPNCGCKGCASDEK
jgi:bud site selection protein 31